jgi:glycosyltransferase involved in cell wall biosynthesis
MTDPTDRQRMKILFAIKRLDAAIGGAERVLCAVCSELAARGHDVTVVSFDRPGGRPFYPLDARIRRIDLAIGDPALPARPLATWRRARALRRVVTQERPQVAVGFMHSMYVPLAFAMAGSGIPVVGSEHTVTEYYRTRPFQLGLLVAAAPFLSKVTVLSEAIRSRYPAPLRGKMLVVPNPVAAAVGQAAPDARKSRHVLLNVARLDPLKHHATLLQAFARVAQAHPDWDLKIIGEGPLRRELETLVRELSLQARVRLPGVTSDMGAEYRAADAFVISSRYESFGLATAEAMSHGLPVAGFADCPGTNELVQHDATGLLAAGGPGRVDALARELARLMSDPGLRRRLGDAGRSAIGRMFSVQHACDSWEMLLGSIRVNS